LYKIHIVQELSDDDFDRCIEFCDLMINRITRDPQFQNNIAFLDEVTFTLTSEINRYIIQNNYRYWNNENLHWIIEMHSQHAQKFNELKF